MAFKKLLKKLKGAGEALGVGQDKEQWKKTKAKRKKAGKWTPGKYAKKAAKQVAKDVKSAAKGSKEYQAAKVEKQKAKNVKKISKMVVKAEKKEKGAGLKAVTIGKGSRPSKLSPTGKIRKKAKGVKVTEGGAYAKYGKKSKAAKSFREAFKGAKGKDFTWDGRKYSGKTADDVKKEKAAKSKAAADKQTASDKRDSGATSPDKYAEGGKVESSGGSNPYGWPSRDARDGGQK